MWRVGGEQTQLQREDVWQVKPASGKYLFISYLCAKVLCWNQRVGLSYSKCLRMYGRRVQIRCRCEGVHSNWYRNGIRRGVDG